MPLAAVLNSSLSVDQTLDASVVFYRDHRLTPLANADSTFSCRVQAPDSGEVLILLQPYLSAGQALVQGQLWVMQSLGVRPGSDRLRRRTPRRIYRSCG